MLRLTVVMFAGCCVAGGWASAADQEERLAVWIDVYRGEPVAQAEVLDDLATARVVYLGERHTLVRHHELQARLLDELAERGTSLVLALEQMEARRQPHLDRYSAGATDFAQMAKAAEWATQWHNYEQYRPVLETARRRKIPIIALNAPAEIIRQVARGGGVGKLSPEHRSQLPQEMTLSDPDYERLLNLQMAVHRAATPERMRPMIEAQLARDEAMAHALARRLQEPADQGRSAVVLCGAGHAAYGLGMVARVRRRMPGVVDRIVLMSESGDVELTESDRAAAREIDITHEQLRGMPRPIADYLHVRGLRGTPEKGG